MPDIIENLTEAADMGMFGSIFDLRYGGEWLKKTY